MAKMTAAEAESRTQPHHGPAADALLSLSDAMRSRGLFVSAGQKVAIAEVIAHGDDGRMSVACHSRLDGLHFCAPTVEGPCRELGPVNEVTEVAALVRRELAAHKDTPGGRPPRR